MHTHTHTHTWPTRKERAIIFRFLLFLLLLLSCLILSLSLFPSGSYMGSPDDSLTVFSACRLALKGRMILTYSSKSPGPAPAVMRCEQFSELFLGGGFPWQPAGLTEDGE